LKASEAKAFVSAALAPRRRPLVVRAGQTKASPTEPALMTLKESVGMMTLPAWRVTQAERPVVNQRTLLVEEFAAMIETHSPGARVMKERLASMVSVPLAWMVTWFAGVESVRVKRKTVPWRRRTRGEASG